MNYARPRLEVLRRPAPAAGVAVLLFVAMAGLLSFVAGYDPVADVSHLNANLPAGPGHWLGTDHLGRDVAWRLAMASRAFLAPGLAACIVCASIAVPAGALAGWYGGAVEAVVRYIFTVLSSVPRFVLVLFVVAIYGNALALLAIAAGFAYVPTLGEAVFARIESLRHAEYLLANRAYGVPDWRILWVHLVVAVCGRLITRHLVLLFGYFLVLETTLSYIGKGFGVQEPTPSWGNMLVFSWGRGSWLNIAAPAIAIWVTILAITLVAQALSDEARNA